MDEQTDHGGAVRPVRASEPVPVGRNANRVIRRGSGPHTVDGDAVIAFCEDRVRVMKSPVTKAIYAGLADRVRRGFFDTKGQG